MDIFNKLLALIVFPMFSLLSECCKCDGVNADTLRANTAASSTRRYQLPAQ